jgi:predicted transcriptional regulator
LYCFHHYFGRECCAVDRPDATDLSTSRDVPTLSVTPTLAAMPSKDDWALLKRIHDQRSLSLTALAKFSGRQTPSL